MADAATQGQLSTNRSAGDMGSQWFPDSVMKKDSPVDQVLQSHEAYLREKISHAGPKAKEKLYRIATSKEKSEQASPDGRGVNRENIVEMLNTMPLDVLSRCVNAEASALATAKSGLDTRRSHGTHRISAKTEEFVLEFDRFLKAYSGIVTIVTAVDQQYGGVASATLSLLFTTVTMKAKDEARIVSAMQHMSDRLPDFKTYQKIYPDPELGTMLADAYKDVILLAREATSYFQGTTLRRHLRSMGKPTEFELMEQKMRENFNRIKVKTETLLAQRVDELMGNLEEMQKRTDQSLVAALRESLALGDYQIEKAKEDLISHRATLQSAFHNDRKRQKMGLAEFLNDTACQCWSNGGSLVFLLAGKNETGKSLISESWLSPVAVELTQDLLERGSVVAFEMCDKDTDLGKVLSRLIFQLLDANPTVIRKADDWRFIESHISSRSSERLKNLAAALLRIINLQKEPVFIILDRPELSREDDAGEFIKTMLDLVRQTTGELKVLIVQRTELWDFDKNRYGVVSRNVAKELLQAIRLDQRRIR